MRGRSATALLIGAVICGSALAGCGGGDDNGETSSMTKAQFVKRADAICAKAAENKQKAVANAFSSRSLKALPKDKEVQEELLLEVLPPVETMTDELAALGAPSGDEERVEEMIASFRSAVEGLEENPLEGLGEDYDSFDEANELAAAYGLEACSAVS